MYRSKARVGGEVWRWKGVGRENAVWSTESWREEEVEFWRGSALRRASSRPLERADKREDWQRGEGQRRRVNEQVVKVFQGGGWRRGVGWVRGGAWIFHWASETEGEGGREGETPVRWSVHWPLFAVFLCKLFGILQELFTIFRVLLR